MENKNFLIFKKIFFIFFGFILLIELYLIMTNQKISISISDSLPFHFFLINKNQSKISNIKNGDFIQFRNNNINFYNGKNITKQILASSGDKIEIILFNDINNNLQGEIFFKNVKLFVKDYSKLGTKLHIVNNKVIPKDSFFVFGYNENSFDSRYLEFGLIKKEDIIGVAKPLF